MSKIYDILGKKYNLSDDYKVLTLEEEIKKISIYQNPKTPNHIKQAILEEFWNNHKTSIVKEAIKYYTIYYQKTTGSVTVEIDDLIQKGAMALTHCLNIYKTNQPKSSKKSKQKGKANKTSKAKFSTLLHWWLRPFILNKINQENYMIYVPRYKGSKHKSILVDSLDKSVSDDSQRTMVEYIKSTDPTPDQLTNKTLFWDQIKEILTKEEYQMLIHWLSYKKYFKTAKQLYEKYNMTSNKFLTKIHEILEKLKLKKNEFEGWN